MTEVEDSEPRLQPLRAQVYRDPRPPEAFARYHERARTRAPDFVYDVVRILTCLCAWTLFRARGRSAERVPPRGAVILAANHFSYMDHFFMGAFTRRRVRFMAKSQLFKRPMDWVYSHGGVFPVRRGAQDDEAFVTANAILARGGCVAMYLEGGRSRSGTLSTVARPGVGRLALESGATVVPVAIHGSARVRNWRRAEFPRITVQFGEPLRFERVPRPTRAQAQRAAEDVFADIKRLYGALEGR